MAQGKYILALSVQDASEYPARIGFEVLDAKGERVGRAFREVSGPTDVIEMKLDLPEKFWVQAYEDANQNGKMDKGFFTQPLELYGFSNKAWAKLAKPDVEEMLVPRTGATTKVHIKLRSVKDFD